MAMRVAPEFSHIRDWIFDLDNCLYPASTGLFALIDERMTAYIQRLLDCDFDEAHRVQKDHFPTRSARGEYKPPAATVHARNSA